MSRALTRLLVYAPTGTGQAGPIVAAGRAGALGVLNFDPDFDAGLVVETAGRVARYLDRPFGLRLPAEELSATLLRGIPENLRVLILTLPESGGWEGPLEEARALGRRVVAEVTSGSQAESAVASGIEALVLAGHEAGGSVADESSLVLLQDVRRRLGDGVPVWVRGGIGLNAAAACVASGASGVVLDGALLHARESPLSAEAREWLGRFDGSETVVLGPAGSRQRLFALPGAAVLARLREAAESGEAAWRSALRTEVGWGAGQAWPVGQDGAFAADLARRFVTVGGIVQAAEQAIDDGIRKARELRPLGEKSPLAVSHGTRYPIVQGPMTRVSDSASFAAAVADGGALPFLALALMRESECRTLLAEASARLSGRSWGVGILGFVPSELRREQVAAIREVRPPFALIAGGRPDQARELEREGIATYLHAPSPGLLKQYLKDGARRFVLEGRECGGHVGPRSSLVLWEQGVEVVRDAVERGEVVADEVHLLFAGGIHDARSASAVAALAAPLAMRGVKVGVLMGTAYLFTEEAVATGAVVPGFQAEAIACMRTVLLETGPGHEVRVSPTPFALRFEAERRRLQAEGHPPEAIREALERLNTGRLRVAAKGFDRAEDAGSPLVPIHPYDQHDRGVYMLGQVAALRDRVITIRDLHREVAWGSGHWLERVEIEPPGEPSEGPARPSEVAIIGMAAILPGASDVGTFWENTLRGVDAITEIPTDRWEWRDDYDPDPKAPDKISSKWGGFLPEVPFDPLRYGMPPSSVPSIEPMQLLTLEAVRRAIEDAGYRDRPFARDRTAVVLGAGGGAAQLAMGYAVRSYLPLIERATGEDLSSCREILPEWTEDSFPGILLNVAAGRVANRFNLGGSNYTVDAACGSSLAAAALAVRELETGAADVVILGGADTVQNPFTYLAFSKTHALSPRGRCRPFDAKADGIVISEGVAVLVLKRRADAERDGDRIYAVIQGVGASSDGRAKGLTAPRPEGQVSALRRAYAKAGISPATVGYVEAHGTGTAAGDLAEIEALSAVFEASGAERASCALGSVKSLIGHTKCAAGLAGLINASLALYHKTLPPTIGIETPNSRAGLNSGPFHLSTTARPWLHDDRQGPRRAGVSAFGFGGTNFHAVLEEYDRDPLPAAGPLRTWPAELLVWRAESREGLIEALDRVGSALENPTPPDLMDLSACLAARFREEKGAQRLAIVAESSADLRKKIGRAREAIAAGTAGLSDPTGIFYEPETPETPPRLAFLFPGQGSQRPDMLGALALAVPAVRAGFQAFDDALRSRGLAPVGPRIFAPPAFDEAGQAARRIALQPPEVAQPALGAACTALLDWLGVLGVEPDALAGHSFGELVALQASGALTRVDLAELAEARGRWMTEAASGHEPGGMAALAVGADGIGELLQGIESVWPVNWNGPRQTVVSGTVSAVSQVVERARSQGVRAQPIAVAGAFHTPGMEALRPHLTELAAARIQGAPRRPVYSNLNAEPYPLDPRQVSDWVGRHVVSPVRFAAMIEAMHTDGIRVFVEVGPGATLTPLVGSILEGRPHQAIAMDRPGLGGLAAALQAIGRLFVAGVPILLERLHDGRSPRRLDPRSFLPLEAIAEPTPTTWLVNGARARPVGERAPSYLGASAGARPAGHHDRKNGALRETPAVAARSEACRLDGPGYPPARPHTATPGSTRVVAAFQETMRNFLQAQRTTMLDYLNGRDRPATATDGMAVFAGEAEPTAEDENSQICLIEQNPEFEISSLKSSISEEPSILESRDLIPTLLKIVGERTGYPMEILRLELDLEADLGIDSIKRVEILGSLRDVLPGLGLGVDAALMDDLTRARTLGAIVARIERIRKTRDKRDRETWGEACEPRTDTEAGEVRRFLLEACEAPLPTETASLAPGGLVLVTDDGRGIGREVAADLRALGHPVVRVRHGLSEGDIEGINLTSEAAIDALLERVRVRGELAGIVHLLPLRERDGAGLDTEAWSARMGAEVRGLFLLARAAADDLARAAERGGACLIAGTRLGGTFGALNTAPAEFFPGQGGVAGLVKTLSHEWPGVRSRVVDFEPAGVIEVIAADVVREIFTRDGRAEVGYRDGRRQRLRAVESPLSGTIHEEFLLQPGESVILTGGARGITAVVARELARRWRPTLLLIGSGPEPGAEEDPETAGIVDAADLKAALLTRLRRGNGQIVGPAVVEKAFLALRREREIRESLRVCRGLGANVRYIQADVRDSVALGRALDAWRDEFGPPVGLIHGAGVIRDKLLREKSPESFDEVIGTKLDGAVHLARGIDASRLRFAALFSSVASRFGNRGQSDYAAANEALNKLALWLDRRWPAHVVSLAWGPWSSIGMVSDLEAHLSRRGLGLIPPEVGGRRLVDELLRGRKGDVEVIVAGDLGPLGGPSWAGEERA